MFLLQVSKIVRGVILASLILAVGGGCNKKGDEGSSRPQSSPGANAGEPSGGKSSKGVGPVQSLQLGSTLDGELAERGEKFFSGTCSACHKLETRYVGPALNGVTLRRSPEWIMNMILNPAEMTEKDDTAKALLATYLTQMSVSVTQEDARAVLEYFRKNDSDPGRGMETENDEKHQ